MARRAGLARLLPDSQGAWSAFQKLFRHSDPRLAARSDTRLSKVDLDAAVFQLPDAGLVPLAMTGTDATIPLPHRTETTDKRTSVVAGLVAGPGGNHSKPLRTIDATDDSDHEASEGNDPARIMRDCEPLRTSDKSGEGEIRTPGTLRYAGFQDRCNRPLCHPSVSPVLA